MRVTLLTLFVTIGVAACSSSAPVVVTPGSTSASSSTVGTSSASAPTTSAPTSDASSSGTHRTPQLRIVPHAQLHSPQQVTVHATGFAPGEALQIVQCAQKGSATGPGDCNLDAMQSAVADAQGALSTKITVVRGPFGANRIVCDARQACLVSVTQASLSPSDEADAPITFAAP